MNAADLCDLDNPVFFFPVRHHSPTCARLVVDLIGRMRPNAVLIEGPSDFNDRIDELFLEHELPIAIYSYVRSEDGIRRGTFYPYCDYSPEWQALRTARNANAVVRFIDLPWAEVNKSGDNVHRYADAELRRGRYVRYLCEKLGVDDFDELWDKVIEVEQNLSLDEYLRRAHEFCYHVRLWEQEIGASDRRREAFMAAEIRRASEEYDGRILVVTGGFHSAVLFARLNGEECVGADSPEDYVIEQARGGDERGIALTPYSYERLDNFTGYDAGMPSPGFYHHVWQCHRKNGNFSHRPLLARVVKSLRKRKQTVSTADLIAVETMARGLAALRGRDVIWRQDLLDAVMGALVKEELELGCESPFLEEVLRVFRGDRRGRLAADAKLPPLVDDIRRRLNELDLVPRTRDREVELDLLQGGDLPRSRVLHCLRILDITGFKRIDGVDFASRDDLSRLWELWRIGWTPNYDADCIEAARYGTTLAEAVTECLGERAQKDSHSSALAATILLDAALAGVDVVTIQLVKRLETLVRQDGEFISVILL